MIETKQARRALFLCLLDDMTRVLTCNEARTERCCTAAYGSNARTFVPLAPPGTNLKLKT